MRVGKGTIPGVIILGRADAKATAVDGEYSRKGIRRIARK